MHIHPSRMAPLFYPLMLATGVTGVRDAGSAVPLDTLNLWRREILAGARVGPPRQVLSGPSISPYQRDSNQQVCRGEVLGIALSVCVIDTTCDLEACRPLLDSVQTARARHLVDSLRTAGADMIKIRVDNPALWFVMAAEARRVGIPFGGHVERHAVIEASDSGAHIIDHPTQHVSL